MNRKIRRVLVWTGVVIVGLPVVLYLVLVAINWRDRDPSPLTVKLNGEYRANSNVSIDDNAYVDAMGFGATPNEDPHALGLQRVQWIRKINQVSMTEAGPDPRAQTYDFKSKRDEKSKAISEACNRDPHSRFVGTECLNAMGDISALKDWVSSEAWLLDRYKHLLARSNWVDEIAADTSLPLPPFASVLEGQKLLLVDAMILAKENRAVEIQKLLASDVRFWRKVLSSTNLLITRMIAVAALDRHFAMANVALKQLPSDAQLMAMPTEWQQPISLSERSLRRVIIGEWVFASDIFRKYGNSHVTTADETRPVNHGFLSWLSQKFGARLFQVQDTINRMAVQHMRLVDSADVGYAELGRSLQKFDSDLRSEFSGSFPFRSAYNPIGQILVSTTAPAYSGYASRAADIEGVRRATLAAVELRAASIKPDDVPAALNKSSQVNPYNNEPFTWSENERAIVFKGLERGERGEHHIYY